MGGFRRFVLFIDFLKLLILFFVIVWLVFGGKGFCFLIFFYRLAFSIFLNVS